MDDEKDEPIHYGLTNLMHWDKFTIVIAAVLSLCWVAVIFKPSLGTALTKVLDEQKASQKAQAAIAPEPAAPGIVTVYFYPSEKKTAPAVK